MKKKEIVPEDAFIREVEEDLKNESMRKIWNKYGFYVVLLVIVSLSIAVSFEGIKAWYIKRIENWSTAYAYALSLENQGKYDESIEAFDYISNQDYGIFTNLAKMEKANALFAKGSKEDALVVLSEIAQDSGFNSQLRDVAIVKLASYKVDNAPVEEVLELLSPIAEDNKNVWHSTAQDMLATLALREGKTKEAIEIYNQILQDENAQEELKQRIRNIISVL